ncbi:MAG: hypothetical protein KGJ89_00390 [Patescibacteria group bacterium]|nr:hypothetical protein [Patescibacteria group bacterium]MDE2014979.1 hypothetical protein [Patescibacteria group bacterium]MDE2226408.1 hypothetical protein [Patescibacteria group bacterium]
MDNNQKSQDQEKMECKCPLCEGKGIMHGGMCQLCHWGHWGHGGGHRIFRLLIKLAIIFLVFWFGVKVGQVSNRFRTYMHNGVQGGYYNMMAPDENYGGGYGPWMMRGYNGYAAPQQSTTTQK